MIRTIKVQLASLWPYGTADWMSVPPGSSRSKGLEQRQAERRFSR
jgi:hypothetical protein